MSRMPGRLAVKASGAKQPLSRRYSAASGNRAPHSGTSGVGAKVMAAVVNASLPQDTGLICTRDHSPFVPA